MKVLSSGVIFLVFTTSISVGQVIELGTLSRTQFTSGSLVQGLCNNNLLFTGEQLEKDLFGPKNQESIATFLLHLDDLHSKSTLLEINKLALQARLHYGLYSDLLMQRYDSFSELRLSGGPDANQELCLQHLSQLNERLDVQVRERYNSKDVNLALLLNTYGRISPSFYLGNGFWPGAYEECLRLKIETPAGQLKTRYCVAHVSHESWITAKTPLNMMTAMKSGVCLPKSCDSLNYKNKYELVFRLMQYNLREIDRNQGNLSDLYCLPDRESPLLALWMHPKSVMFLSALLLWALFLLYATVKGQDNDSGTSSMYKSLSIYTNLRLLFTITKPALRPPTINCGSENVTDSEKDKPSTKRPLVDLRMLDGIKVIAQVYVIIGHMFIMMMPALDNMRGTDTLFLFAIANLSPGYVVNFFLATTGLLNSYLLFKQNESRHSLSSMSTWIHNFVLKYSRMMPMFIIVILYSKYLAKFTGAGPFWDYGTSALGHRRRCEEESWLYTILLVANQKSPADQCLVTGWYLSNDFQFYLVTPILLNLLQYRPKLGKSLIYLCIFASFMASYISIMNVELDDFKPIVAHWQHAFKTLMINLWVSYTKPQYRILSYLNGILVGHWLYIYEKDKLKPSGATGKVQPAIPEVKQGYIPAKVESFFTRHGLAFSLFMCFLCPASPYLGKISVFFGKGFSHRIVAIFEPLYHLLFSVSIGAYLMASATGNGSSRLDAFLSAAIWKPLSKLNLIIMLINVEVIYYIVETRYRYIFLDTFSLISLYMISVLASYLIAILLYVSFEAPIRVLVDYLLAPRAAKSSTKKSLPEPVQRIHK